MEWPLPRILGRWLSNLEQNRHERSRKSQVYKVECFARNEKSNQEKVDETPTKWSSTSYTSGVKNWLSFSAKKSMIQTICSPEPHFVNSIKEQEKCLCLSSLLLYYLYSCVPSSFCWSTQISSWSGIQLHSLHSRVSVSCLPSDVLEKEARNEINIKETCWGKESITKVFLFFWQNRNALISEHDEKVCNQVKSVLKIAFSDDCLWLI